MTMMSSTVETPPPQTPESIAAMSSGAGLTDREHTILFSYYYCKQAGRRANFASLGRQLGMTREAARRAYQRALSKLSEHLGFEVGEPEYDGLQRYSDLEIVHWPDAWFVSYFGGDDDAGTTQFADPMDVRIWEAAFDAGEDDEG
jgi:hypothetical protein